MWGWLESEKAGKKNTSAEDRTRDLSRTHSM